MKKTVHFLIILGCFLFLLSGCQRLFSVPFSPIQTPTLPQPTTTPDIAIMGMTMIETTRVEESEEYGYRISLVHPVLQNAGEDTMPFNTLLNEKILSSVDDFRAGAISSYEAMSEPVGGSFYDLDYAVYYFNEHFVSLQLLIQAYTGGAHPWTNHIVLNYDFRQHREVSLVELFLPESRILEVLQGYCAAELDARFPDGYFEEGLKPIAENYRYWNLSEEGLVLTFQTYQVQAGVWGPQTVVIPYSWLEQYINPEGPLNFLLDEVSTENTI